MCVLLRTIGCAYSCVYTCCTRTVVCILSTRIERRDFRTLVLSFCCCCCCSASLNYWACYKDDKFHELVFLNKICKIVFGNTLANGKTYEKKCIFDPQIPSHFCDKEHGVEDPMWWYRACVMTHFTRTVDQSLLCIGPIPILSPFLMPSLYIAIIW